MKENDSVLVLKSFGKSESIRIFEAWYLVLVHEYKLGYVNRQTHISTQTQHILINIQTFRHHYVMTSNPADPGSIKEQSEANLKRNTKHQMKQNRSASSKSSSTHSCTANSRDVDVTRKGGAGGCMLGGSEEDLCLPVRSREPGFQPGDPWAIPERPDGCTVGRKREKEERLNVRWKESDFRVVYRTALLFTLSLDIGPAPDLQSSIMHFISLVSFKNTAQFKVGVKLLFFKSTIIW